MKNSFVLTLLLLSSVLCISLFAEEQFDYDAFGRLPVQKDGRVKPIDTVARNALLVLRGKQTIKKGSTKIPAIQWFLDVVFNPDRADDHKVFRVDHPEVLAIFGYRPGEEKYFSFNDLFKRDEIREINDEIDSLLNRFQELHLSTQGLSEDSEEFKQTESQMNEIRQKFKPLQIKREALQAKITEIDSRFRRIKLGEDINGNGNIDEGEDLNNNGELDPGPNSKKYTTYQRQAMKLYGALSLYDQLKSGFFMSLQESVFGKEYSNFLDASKKLDAAIHQVEAEGNGPAAAAAIQHASLLARDELNQFGTDLSREQYDQVIFKYRVAMRAARNNIQTNGNDLSDDEVNDIFSTIKEFSELYREFEFARSFASRNAKFSVLGIVPPRVAAGTSTFQTGSNTVKGTNTDFTNDFKKGQQFRIGQQGFWDGIWRDAAVRDKMVEEIISDTELKLNYSHAGRSPLINGAFYLCVIGFSFLIWRRFEAASAIKRVALPLVFSLALILPWLFCFGPSGVDRDSVYLHETDWKNLGEDLVGAAHSGNVDRVVAHYAKLSSAYNAGDVSSFNTTVNRLTSVFDSLAPKMEFDIRSVGFEHSFNSAQPFYLAMSLYVLVFLLVLLSWLWKPEHTGKAAYWLMAVCLFLHTFGLLARIWIQARPPVTNLYSSAVFIGWGAVVLGLLFERLHRNGIGAASGAVVGFVTLIIAHHLGMGGDTMEMMQAVLDTNIWLATHVVVITLGYTAMFLAGILGIVFLIRGIVDSSFEKTTAKTMSSMVYGITCFAVLFSFVGTMLGGIWADQSWGRFWGWDPKENGALLIVIWSAIVLHARWAGLVRERGIMVLSIFGNVITAWSWFGTNLLQEGLHSYGFSEAGFRWLMIFNASQVILMCLVLVPANLWRSQWSKSALSLKT